MQKRLRKRDGEGGFRREEREKGMRGVQCEGERRERDGGFYKPRPNGTVYDGKRKNFTTWVGPSHGPHTQTLGPDSQYTFGSKDEGFSQTP